MRVRVSVRARARVFLNDRVVTRRRRFIKQLLEAAEVTPGEMLDQYNRHAAYMRGIHRVSSNYNETMYVIRCEFQVLSEISRMIYRNFHILFVTFKI